MKTSATEANVIDDIEQEGKKAARSPVVETLTRLGLGVRGVIYIMMGLIAAQVALGSRSSPSDQQGALALIGSQPAGQILLIVVMIGLAGYALWAVIRAIFDPLHMGKDMKGILQRSWSFVSAWFYASLIVPAYDYLTGGVKAAYNGQQTDDTQRMVAKILSLPWGQWIVAILGALVVAIGLGQIYTGLSRDFEKQFELYDLDEKQSRVVKRIGRFGTVARGVVFAISGVLLAIAAYFANPDKAQGIDGALMALAHRPYGFWVLGIVALGLIAFGIYSLMGSAWFRLRRDRE